MFVWKAPSFYLNILEHFKFDDVVGSENCHRSMFTIVLYRFFY